MVQLRRIHNGKPPYLLCKRIRRPDYCKRFKNFYFQGFSRLFSASSRLRISMNSSPVMVSFWYRYCASYTVERGKAMILEAMYNGEFYPCETVVPTSPEYRKAVIACEKLMEQLSQRLSKEDYELVQELRAQTAIAQCEESESHFKYGFSAGLMFSRKPMNKCSRRKKNR